LAALIDHTLPFLKPASTPKSGHEKKNLLAPKSLVKMFRFLRHFRYHLGEEITGLRSLFRPPKNHSNVAEAQRPANGKGAPPGNAGTKIRLSPASFKGNYKVLHQ